MKRGPKMDPPEPPPPCPKCGVDPIETSVVNENEFEDGAVEGDLICTECEAIVRQSVLLREPDFV